MTNETNDQVTPMTQMSQTKTTIEENISNLGQAAMRSIPTIIAIGIAIWWLINGMVKIEQATLDWVSQTEMTAMTIVFGFVYRQLIGQGGFTSAKSTKKYQAVTSDWNSAIRDNLQYQSEILEYAKDMARDNQRQIRRENLEQNELLYENFFDYDGNLIDPDYRKSRKLTSHQKSVIDKCVKMTIEIPTLFGNLSGKFFGTKKEKTQKDYQRGTYLRDGFTTIIFATFTVGITFTFVGFSVSSLIYSFVQILMWSATGVLKRVNNYNFVIDTMAPQIVEKTLAIRGYQSLPAAKKKEYEDRVLSAKKQTKAWQLAHKDEIEAEKLKQLELEKKENELKQEIKESEVKKEDGNNNKQ